jgi:hypothetical protein
MRAAMVVMPAHLAIVIIIMIIMRTAVGLWAW